MKWTLKVKNFGKIKEAEIHDSSLRFIVGDNNSGKSYLMTLLWGMKEIADSANFFKPGFDLFASLINKIQYSQSLNNGEYEFRFCDYADIINRDVNLFLKNIKDEFVSRLFNFINIKIEELSINFNFDEEDKFIIRAEKDKFYGMYVNSIISMLFDMTSIYLPAARTGFMLTKGIINKAGRRVAFGNEKNQYEPFIMPILEFLDIMESVKSDIKSDNQYEKICSLIEKEMLQGILFVSDTLNNEVIYVPDLTRDRLPLRAVSAVVTEMSPLYLLLKNKSDFFNFDFICYEEPEMCLHPQLQQMMARILIRLANAGVNITATTHSDIIIQHVNNMIKLGNNSNRDELMSKYGYEKEDLIKDLDIAMYQFVENGDGTTSLEELKRGKYGFAVPTFNDALDKILEEVYDFQEGE